MNSRNLGKFLVLLILGIASVFIAVVISVGVGSGSASIVTNVVLSILGAVSSFILRSAFFESFVNILESLFFKSSLQDKSQDKKAKILEQEAIINLYYRQQNRELFIVSIIVLVTILACFIANNFYYGTASNSLKTISLVLPTSITAFVLLSLLYCRKLVIEYRIVKGYFGTNRYEAAEIIKFIQKNSDNLDSSGGNRRRVFPQAVFETLRTEIGLQGSGGDL